MNDFAWTSPTQFVFGRDAEEKIGPWAASAGARRALLVFGQGHVVRSGLLARVKASLEGAGVTCIEHGGVRPNPEIALVRDGVAAAREAEVDLIVPIGGGSAIDTAKAIACGAVYDGDAWDFFRRPNPVQPTDALPIAAVLTIPAAGSEASNSCVIQNDAEHAKRGMNADFFRPRAAFMNPELTMTLPAWQTFSGVTDMCAHIFERFFSSTGSVAMTDNLALAALRTIRTASSAWAATRTGPRTASSTSCPPRTPRSRTVPGLPSCSPRGCATSATSTPRASCCSAARSSAWCPPATTSPTR